MALSLQNLFSSFGGSDKGPSKVVGVDIGSVAIKVVEVEDRRGTLTLTTYGELQAGPYDNQPLGEAAELNVENQKNAVVDILRESAVKSRHAVFAMPLSSSFVTIMSMSAKEDEDISSRIHVEARKYIPVPITDVTLDWAELATGEEEEGTREVLLAAIQNEALEKLRELMSSVNMHNQPTEIESFSTVRSLFTEGDGSVAVLDLGGVTSKLYVTRTGLLQRMHRVRAGGSILTTRLAKMLDSTFEEAEAIKRNVKKGDKEYEDVMKVTTSTFERPLQEFKRVMEQYEKKTGEEIERVELTGGVAMMVGIRPFVEDVLQREVEFADPFAKVAYPAFMEDTIKTIGPIFSVALGAALRVFE